MFSPIFLPFDDLSGVYTMSDAYSLSKVYYFFVLIPLSLKSLSDFEDFSV